MNQFGGQWTEIKLVKIHKYLQAYQTALKNKPFRKMYIDAFAGPGYREGGSGSFSNELGFPDIDETVKNIHDGSPRLALQVNPKFDSYVFIDKDATKCKQLEALSIEFPDANINVFNEDANSFLQRYLQKVNWRGWRAVCFLDPYGAQVDWNTIEIISETKAVDLWYLFPLSAVIRMLSKEKSAMKRFREKINRIIGTNDWENKFYLEVRENDLFQASNSIVRDVQYEVVGEYALDRLASRFADVLRKPYYLFNSKNSAQFLLCFAVANKRGSKLAIKIAGDIISKD